MRSCSRRIAAEGAHPITRDDLHTIVLFAILGTLYVMAHDIYAILTLLREMAP